MEAAFQDSHEFLGKFDAGLVGFGDEYDGWLLALISQGACKTENGLERSQEGAIPVLFQSAPGAFNRIVLTMIGGIASQVDGQVKLVDKGREA